MVPAHCDLPPATVRQSHPARDVAAATCGRAGSPLADLPAPTLNRQIAHYYTAIINILF